MDFYSLLKGRWRVKNARQDLSAREINVRVDYLSEDLSESCRGNDINENKIFVFVIRNNMEGMLAYFVASRLKIHAMLLNAKNIKLLNDTINNEHISALVYFGRYQIDEVVKNKKIFLRSDVKEFISSGEERKIIHADGLNEALFYFMTSGTTSLPKLVQYRESSLVRNAHAVSRYLELGPEDSTICFFPVQYMYGLSTMLSSFLSDGSLVFEHFQDSLVPSLIDKYEITTMPLIGDLMLPLSKILKGNPRRIKRILNASDRLLVSQAFSMLPYCETLWNNFGQTESGPRLFCLRINTKKDIEEYSQHGVIAPGFAMNTEIETVIKTEHVDSSYGELYYHTPYASNGYINKDFILTPHSHWIKSGDLFSLDDKGCHFWFSRVFNEFKFKGRFVPTQIISDQVMELTGARHFFSRDEQGIITLNVESSTDYSTLSTIRNLLSEQWYDYPVEINIIPEFSLTPSGKIKLL